MKIKIPKLQWVIAALLFAATALNYLDRQALAVVSVDIRHEFSLNEEDYSQIVMLFLFAYAIMYAGSGYIVDRLGTRRGLGVFIFGWSVAQMLHGLVSGKWSLGACRFLLGLTEPANWPAAAKAVAEWFPASQRALGIGIFNAGSSLGSALASPVVAFVAIRFGWRSAFVFTGILGFAWLAAWLILYEPPHRNRWLKASEYAALKDHVQSPEGTAPVRTKIDWLRVLRDRGCWVLIIARFFTDPVIYFAIFWLPEYLRKERGFDLAMVGEYAWVPFAVGGFGYIAGGWLSGRLIDSGWTLPRSRKFVMALGASVMPVVIFAPRVPATWMALTATCFLTVGHAFWIANEQALPTDLFPGAEVATASGFTGVGGAVGGMLANLGTGYLVSHFSYTPVFLIAGLMHPLSACLVYWLLPDKEFQRKAATIEAPSAA
ncbi:MAG TPA: MFS transporter [Bryobacteraceae bacterium]|nr:MFS transporter [Bryobacteraceae bacterium]